MAKKGESKKKAVTETAKVEVTPEVKTPKTQREKLYDKITNLVAKYNDAKKFNETNKMTKLDEQMKEELSKYHAEAENDCFNELLSEADPMKAAALKMQFDTIKLVDKKEKGVVLDRVIEPAKRTIDPLRLHKKAKNGIGADSLWFSKVENLNVLMTVATAIELEKDGEVVRSTVYQSDLAKNVELACKDNPTDNEMFKQDVTTCIRAMLGGEYVATDAQAHFLRRAHEKAGRDGRSLVCTNATTMRQLLLGVCHDALTGEGFDVIYKMA